MPDSCFRFGIGALLTVALTAVPASAQFTAPARGWADVNFVSADPDQKEQRDGFFRLVSGDPVASMSADYRRFPQANGINVDAGVFVVRGFAVGARYDRGRYDYGVDLGVVVVHPSAGFPTAFDVAASDDELRRTDDVLDISANYVVPLWRDRVRVRFSGGPTYFHVEQGMVAAVEFDQLTSGPGNLVEVTGYVPASADGSGWGWNAGADLSFFFSRFVGVGAGVRVNRGSFAIEQPLSGDEADLDLGRSTFNVGARFRF